MPDARLRTRDKEHGNDRGRYFGDPLLTDGCLYVTELDGRLYVFDAARIARGRPLRCASVRTVPQASEWTSQSGTRSATMPIIATPPWYSGQDDGCSCASALAIAVAATLLALGWALRRRRVARALLNSLAPLALLLVDMLIGVQATFGYFIRYRETSTHLWGLDEVLVSAVCLPVAVLFAVDNIREKLDIQRAYGIVWLVYLGYAFVRLLVYGWRAFPPV